MEAGNMSFTTVDNMIHKLEELTEKAKHCPGVATVEILNYINLVMREINLRWKNKTTNIDEVGKLCKTLYNWLAEFLQYNTLLDQIRGTPYLCEFIPSINSVLRDIKRTIEKNLIYKKYCGSYKDHVEQIMSSKFPLNTYDPPSHRQLLRTEKQFSTAFLDQQTSTQGLLMKFLSCNCPGIQIIHI